MSNKEKDVAVREHCYMSKVYSGKDGHRRVVFVEKDGDDWVVIRRRVKKRAVNAEIFRSKHRLYLRCLPEDELPTIIEEVEDEATMWSTALARYFRVQPACNPVEGGLLPITFDAIAEMVALCGLTKRYPYLSKPDPVSRKVPAAYLIGTDMDTWAKTLAVRAEGLEAVARDLAMDSIGNTGRKGRFYDNLLRCVNGPVKEEDETLLLWEE
jgi:hypothetical protein